MPGGQFNIRVDRLDKLFICPQCDHADDACNQRFNNLSRACTKWLLARETVLSNPLNQGKDEDQLSGVCLRLRLRLRLLPGTTCVLHCRQSESD